MNQTNPATRYEAGDKKVVRLCEATYAFEYPVYILLSPHRHLDMNTAVVFAPPHLLVGALNGLGILPSANDPLKGHPQQECNAPDSQRVTAGLDHVLLEIEVFKVVH